MDGLEAGLIREVVVSGIASNDPTRDIAEEAGAIWIEGEKGRGQQLRAGAQIARGDWLLFVHVDTWLEDGWTDSIRSHIAGDGSQAAAFCLAFRSRTWRASWVAGLANLRARFLGLPYGDQALLISRRLYDEVGGYEPIPLMEDVAIARRLGRRRITMLPVRALTSGAKQMKDGWILRSIRNLWLVTRYYMGADPEALAKAYYGQ